jgi:hypothetical protein
MKNKLTVSVQCCMCSKKHAYSFPLEDHRLIEYTRVFYCPAKKEYFQATITTREAYGKSK